MSADAWTHEVVDPKHPLWRMWVLRSDHMTVRFTAAKDRRTWTGARHVVVEFNREATARTSADAAYLYAKAELCRFMV